MSAIPDWLYHDRMIEPFVDHQVTHDDAGRKIVSYGLSSYGYDLRLDQTFIRASLADPHDAPTQVQQTVFTKKERVSLYAGEHLLAASFERVRVPRNCIGIVYGKSTYARCGLIVNTTPLEPEWEGVVTLCLINSTNRTIFVHPGEGIAQVVFYQSNNDCRVSYKDKGGKYQNSTTVTEGKL